MKILFLSLLVLLLGLPVQAWAEDFGFEEAGAYYNVNPDILRAISWVESGHKTKARNKNVDGSEDHGHMQINSVWAWKLRGGWDFLRTDPKYCTMVGAWIFAQCVAAYGSTWNAVSCYHTGAAPGDVSGAKRERGLKYIERVKRALERRKVALTEH